MAKFALPLSFDNPEVVFTMTYTKCSGSRCLQNRIDTVSRRFRALANVIGWGGVYSQGQVEFIESLLATEGAVSARLVPSVPELVRQASHMSLEVLVWDSHQLLRGCTKDETVRQVHNMFRAASVADFPPCQMRAIFALAPLVGLADKDLLDITRRIEDEQRSLHGVIGCVSVPLAA